jgi:hypothetical protein
VARVSVQGVTALIVAVTGLVGSVGAIAGLLIHVKAQKPK